MSVPTAPAQMGSPIADTGAGAFHQKVAAPLAHSTTLGNIPFPAGAMLDGGVTGIAYGETISAQGGTSPYTFAVTAGALPAGLSLASDGVISGTPTTGGTASFTVTVTDSASATGSQAFQIAVAAPGSGGGGGSYVFLG